MTTGIIMQTLIYVISMEFLWLSRKRSSSQNVPSGKEPRETADLKGYFCSCSSGVILQGN